MCLKRIDTVWDSIATVKGLIVPQYIMDRKEGVAASATLKMIAVRLKLDRLDLIALQDIFLPPFRKHQFTLAFVNSSKITIDK